jgi:hypothetical protein
LLILCFSHLFQGFFGIDWGWPIALVLLLFGFIPVTRQPEARQPGNQHGSDSLGMHLFFLALEIPSNNHQITNFPMKNGGLTTLTMKNGSIIWLVVKKLS